jgi:RNA-directed DNA polymerase
MRDLQRWMPTEGTPQGAVISPLLANGYLHPLDELMAARGYRMVRYADDFVVLCRSRERADAALAENPCLGGKERPASASGQNACR